MGGSFFFPSMFEGPIIHFQEADSFLRSGSYENYMAEWLTQATAILSK